VKKLLVGSVYAPTPNNALWYDLQLRFLRKTLGDSFDHIVAAIRVPTDLFKQSTVVHAVPPETDFDWWETDIAFERFFEYFLSHDEYEHYLILDSDAFPFRQNWLEELLHMMRENIPQGLPRRRIASAVRGENLDTFPHACVFFMEGDYFRSCDPANHLRLVCKRKKNLMGIELNDMMLMDEDIYDQQGNQIWLPLIRTNTWNPHPIMAAIYGHMFYHQGAGSRIPHFRAVDLGAFENYLTHEDHITIAEALRNWLREDPEKLCAALAAPFDGTMPQHRAKSLLHEILGRARGKTLRRTDT
jgi:hypothetical protein